MHIWEGIYKNFSEVPASGQGFSGQKWLKNSLRKARGFQNHWEINSGDALLPILASIVAAQQRQIKILDFGGGLGFDYLPVKIALAKKSRLFYHIVENPQIVAIGNRFFKREKNLKFLAALPQKQHRYDIINFASSLHYVGDWKQLLQKIIRRFKPRFLLFTDLPAGNIPTYASAQNYYGSKIPVWIFNNNELIETMANLGYRCLLRSLYKEYAQDNFPENYRLKCTCTLLFALD